MEWTRSETIGLASASCVFCRGLGLRKTRIRGLDKPCGCVFRAIFRSCYARYRHCLEKAGRTSAATIERTDGPSGNRLFGRRNEEFIADFELTCKRALDQEEYQLFRYHFLLGADWKLCTTKLNLDRGTFFHLVYKLQEQLGRVFRELEPYALFPLDQYFGGMNIRRVHASQLCTLEPLSEGTEEEEEEELELEEDHAPTTKLIELPRRSNTVSRHFPIRQQLSQEEDAA
ncbi:hypothetical protein [Bryobacter aggregatus]|uniref:hypothetical protein n=1 Tax=Bryobacter aggregatus TaxID=360054 RepID=UPI0004E15C11|nr:hypothetical protein [Bryobacter aggregatus]